MEKTWALAPWLPCYLAARRYTNSNGNLPTHWDWAAKALDVRVPEPFSELVPPRSPVDMHDNLPGAGSTLKNPPSDDFSPSSTGPPFPDVRLRSVTPPRVCIPRTSKPAHPTPGSAPNLSCLSEYIVATPIAQLDMGGRACDGRR